MAPMLLLMAWVETDFRRALERFAIASCRAQYAQATSERRGKCVKGGRTETESAKSRTNRSISQVWPYEEATRGLLPNRPNATLLGLGSGSDLAREGHATILLTQMDSIRY